MIDDRIGPGAHARAPVFRVARGRDDRRTGLLRPLNRVITDAPGATGYQ